MSTLETIKVLLIILFYLALGFGVIVALPILIYSFFKVFLFGK